MAKKLDLTAFQEQLFELKLLDGSVVHLRKPSQKVLMELMAFSTKDENLNQVEAIRDITLTILNCNKESRKFAASDIEEYDLLLEMAIIQGYSEFVNEVMSNPNS